MKNPETNQSLNAKLAGLTLRSRLDLEVSRHVSAGKVAYILRDPVTFESHRFTQLDYEVFVGISSGLPLADVFRSLVEKARVKSEAENDFYQFAAELVNTGLVGLPASSGKTLYQRANRRRKSMLNTRLQNFLFQKIPLFNPDQFLDRTIHVANVIYTKWFVRLWLLALILAMTIVCRRWNDFTNPMADMLTVQNLPLLWGILFGLKFVHEFGHAYACKKFGGNVPAMGLYMIAGNPCAFVDASAAWGFPSRWHRVVVSLGGMYVESIVGIAAVFVWAFASSPWLVSCAHQVVVMATLVTLIFNANPLMKYDGYFVLCDLTGIPNLRQRSAEQLRRLLKKSLLGLTDNQITVSAGSVMLISYGIASTLYRLVVVIGISSMVATQFALAGLAMGGYYIASTLYGLYRDVLRYLWYSPEVQAVQGRARVASYCMIAALPLLLLTPMPSGLRSSGRVASRDELEVANESAGIVRRVYARPGQVVTQDSPLVQLENSSILAQHEKDAGELLLSGMAWHSEMQKDVDEAAATARKVDFLDRQLRSSEQDLHSLLVAAKRHGVVMSCLSEYEAGQFLPAGSTVAVVGSGPWTIKVITTAEVIVSSQAQVGQNVGVRIKSQPGCVLSGRIISIAKAGDRFVSEDTLTHLAGGQIAVDPQTDEAGVAYFELTVQPDLREKEITLMHGMTAEVRLNRRLEFVGQEVYRRVAKFINQILTS